MLSGEKQFIEEKAKQPITPSIKMLNESFNFDWNDYRTIEPNKAKVTELESFIEKILPSLDTLEEGDRYALAQLCYKLGTFYNHINRTPALALEKLLIAETLLSGHKLAWTKLHIAFSYQQMLATSKKANNTVEVNQYAALAMKYYNQLIEQYASSDEIEAIKITGFAYCVKALAEYEIDQLDAAINSYSFALNLYITNGLIDDQYARAKNRYAQFLAAQGKYDEANNVFAELDLVYWSIKQDQFNPYRARCYVSYADYLSKFNPDKLSLIMDKYKKAYDILRITDGEQSSFTLEIAKKVSETQEKLIKKSFDVILGHTVNELMELPFEARDIFIENFSTFLLRGFVPMSGMTVQQYVPADTELLEYLNTLTKKQDAYKNGKDARYVYQFAREATSGGVIPVYRNKTTGDIYLALICNKRNLDMYNWSAGYTEAPLPPWRGKLQSEAKQEIYFNRDKIIDSAANTMKKTLEAADGDWTNVEYNYQQFAQGFKSEGVILPNIDINSLHTASRECFEEINLDLDQFPQRKSFLISHDNTVGVSQGDAPGQASNRSHQYMVYLGELDEQPAITPADDVAIADWINVSDIQRKNNMEYFANGKPLSIYMLRGLELGLKNVWHFLLQQSSTQVSRYSGKSIIRFSNPENVVAEIENFCDNHGIKLEGSCIARFLQYLSGDLPSKTYTGKSTQPILNCLLETAKYLMSQKLNPETFVKDMMVLLAPLDTSSKLYSNSANLLHFKPVTAQKEIAAPDSSLLQKPTFSMSHSEEKC